MKALKKATKGIRDFGVKTGFVGSRIEPRKIPTPHTVKLAGKPDTRAYGNRVVTAEMHLSNKLTLQQNFQELNDMDRSIHTIKTLVNKREMQLKGLKPEERKKALKKLKVEETSYFPRISKRNLNELTKLHGMLNTMIRHGDFVKRLEAIHDNPNKVKFAWLFPSGNYKSHIGNGRKFLKRVFDKAVRIKKKPEPMKFFDERGNHLFDLKTKEDINRSINWYNEKIAKASKGFNYGRYNQLKEFFVNTEIIPSNNSFSSFDKVNVKGIPVKEGTITDALDRMNRKYK